MNEPAEVDYDALDLAATRAEIAVGMHDVKLSDAGVPTIHDGAGRWERFRPSVNVVHAWPIIERDGITIRPLAHAPNPDVWEASAGAHGAGA